MEENMEEVSGLSNNQEANAEVEAPQGEKLTELEILNIKELQEKQTELDKRLVNVAKARLEIDYSYNKIQEEFEVVAKMSEKLGKSLREKYGDVSIDIEKGIAVKV